MAHSVVQTDDQGMLRAVGIFDETADFFTATHHRVAESWQLMQHGYQGESAVAFGGGIESWLGNFARVIRSLGDMSRQLQRTAGIYDAADRDGSSLAEKYHASLPGFETTINPPKPQLGDMSGNLSLPQPPTFATDQQPPKDDFRPPAPQHGAPGDLVLPQPPDFKIDLPSPPPGDVTPPSPQHGVPGQLVLPDAPDFKVDLPGPPAGDFTSPAPQHGIPGELVLPDAPDFKIDLPGAPTEGFQPPSPQPGM